MTERYQEAQFEPPEDLKADVVGLLEIVKRPMTLHEIRDVMALDRLTLLISAVEALCHEGTIFDTDQGYVAASLYADQMKFRKTVPEKLGLERKIYREFGRPAKMDNSLQSGKRRRRK